MLKSKKCKQCLKLFRPFNSLEKVCSLPCAIEYGKAERKRKFKQTTRQMRQEHNLKDRPYQLRKAQAIYNTYIRARDQGAGCISCGKSSGAKINAGHYLSVGAHPELRFEELNCHLQCEWCNTHLSGNIAKYRINLIKKIGLRKVEWLEGPHGRTKYLIADIIKIQEKYTEMTMELKK